MEPKLPTPDRGFEQFPAAYDKNAERSPAERSPETVVEEGRERFEARSEAAPTAVNAAPVLPPPVIAPAPPVPLSDDANDAPVDDTPSVANDDDLIEREWVDKAKKIIIETKDDPYRREREVGKLQIDYLRKRYGKELGIPE